MKEHKSSLQNEVEIKTGRVFQVSIITATVMGLAAILFAFYDDAPADFTLATLYKSYSASFAFGTIGIMALVSAWLARRGRASLGIGLIIGALNIVFLNGILFEVSGIGLILASMTLVLTTGIATMTLSKKHQTWAIGSATTVAVLILLLDLIKPFNPPAVGDPTFSQIIGGLLVGIYGFFILRNFRQFALRAKLITITVLITLIFVAGGTFIVARTLRTAMTEQIGENFTTQADSMRDLAGAFFLEKVSQIQALAATDVVKEAISERNASYSGSSDSILAEIEALDDQWRAGSDNDPLIMAITTADKSVNPSGYQIEDFVEAFPDHAEIFITDRYGATIAANNVLSDYYQADEDWWQAAWNGGQGAVYLSDPEFDESAGVTASLIAVPVVDEASGEVIGIVRSTLLLDELFALFSSVQVGQTGHAVLFDASGQVLYDPQAGGEESGSAGLPPDLRQHIVSSGLHFIVSQDEQGDEAIFGHGIIHVYGRGEGESYYTNGESTGETYEAHEQEEGVAETHETLDEHEEVAGETHQHQGHQAGAGDIHIFEEQIGTAVSNLGWAVVIRQQTGEAFAAVDQTVSNIIIAGLVAAGLLSLAMVVIARVVTQPLITLSTAAEEIGAGNLEAPLPQAGQDEVGRLTVSFSTMVGKLRDLLAGLEQRVADRTRGLELAAEVGQFLSAMHDLDTLLPEAVELIRSNFDLYYVQIYLTNPSGRAIVLRAGSGSVGEQLVRRGHRLPVGPGSINGVAVAEKRSVTVADTAESKTFLPNPLLPDTRSEMAVPLIASEQVVGVLNLQHNEPNTLNEEVLSTFEALAGQLAIAVENANLFATVEQARLQTENYARRLTSRGWEDFLNAVDRSERLGYTYDADTISQLEEALPTAGSDEHTLAASVAVGGETIGALHLESQEGRAWTDDEAELVTVVGRQVAQQIENLRLLAQAEQYRIEAEAAVRRTTREGWQAYIDSLAPTKTGYSYDLNKVMPVAVPVNGDEAAMSRLITIYGEPIGELAIAETDELDDEATELLAIVAEQLSEHIEKARLTEETEKALGQTEDQAARLAALNKMSDALSRVTEINDIFKIIASEIDGIVEGDRTSVALFDETDNKVEIYALNGETGIIPTGASLPLAESVVGRAIQENIIINTPDTRQDEMIDTRSMAEHGLYSTLVAPLAIGQKVIGTLNIARKEPQAFVGRDEDLIRQVASLMASIIERKRAEEALKESEQRMSLHVQQTPLAVIEWNLDFEVVEWNPAAEKIFGFTEEEALGRHAAGLIVPESAREIVDQVWSELITEQGGTRSTNENITKDGKLIVCDWYNTPLIDNNGQVIGVASLVEDITEVKQAEERTRARLRVSEALAGVQTEDEVLDAMVQAADINRQVRVAIYTLDPEETDELVCISRRDETFDSGIVSTIPIGSRVSSSQLTVLQQVSADTPFISSNFLEDERVDEATRELPRKMGYVSGALIPITAGKEWLGLLVVVSKEEAFFDEHKLFLYHMLAEQGGIALHTTRLYDEIQRGSRELEARTRELEASQQVTFAATEHSNPDELLNLVVNLIRDQFDLYHAQVYLVDQEHQVAVLKESTGYAGRQLLKRQHQIALDSPSLVTRAIKTGEPILVADVSQDENWLPNDLLPHTQAELVVPLKVGGQAIGALDVQSRSTDQLSERTVALFQTMTDQVAFLFENSELLSHVSAQTASLTRFTGQLRTAAEVTERLNTILDPDALLEEVVSMLQNRFDLYHAHIYLLDADEETLVLKAGSGELGKVMRERGHKIPFNREQSLVARAARNQEIVMVKDVSREPSFMPNPLLPDTRSEVAIPLVTSSGLLGVLDMQDSRPERFEQTDLDTFSTLAGQVATALENARLFEEIQQTAQYLRQVDRMKSEFLANMSHELRTPLNSIIGYSEMMLMGISGDLPEEVVEDVQAIYDNGKHLLHVISDILDLAKIEAGRLNLQFEDVSIGALLDEIKVNNAGLFMNKPIELIVEAEEDLPEFRADPIRLNQIFNNLISNAAKFTPEGHVAVRASRDGGWIVFEVDDTGVGISEEDLKEVFEKFMQVDGSFTRRAEGTGLGLAITRHLVHLHGGEITLRSQLDVGTTFTIRLPLKQPQVGTKEEMVYEMAAATPANGTQ